MSFNFPARWLALLPALTASIPLTAAAQIAAPPPYQSAFEGQHSPADSPPVDWRQANDAVRSRGAEASHGAHGAHGGHGEAGTHDMHGGHDAHSAHPPPLPAQGTQGAQPPANDPHAGHRMPSKAQP